MHVAPVIVVVRSIELFVVGIALLSTIRATKLHGFALHARASAGDLAAWAAVSIALAATAALLPAIGIALAAVAWLLLFGLWLDAVLFRVFTIELGPGGVGGVVLGVLYRELSEMACARRFFRGNRVFAWLPIAALVMLALPTIPLGAIVDLVAAGALVAYLVALLTARTPTAATRRQNDRGAIATFLLPRPLPVRAGFHPRDRSGSVH